jgi:pyrimidine-nucleoside phosphorylase
MRAVDLIMKKREGLALSEAEIRFLVFGAVSKEIPDYQVSAWLMAVFFRGMGSAETALLTQAMLESGDRMDLSGLAGPFVDKHSTGGVGDKTSLMLAPAVAACGLYDPMMSGRSLGHTGGTLDKLDSIPGYRSLLSQDEFARILKKVGFAMTGQTERIVPADKLLYALRDVTATVESIPLITASILSKKAAEGTDALVLDVKFGSGAFMKTFEDAVALADSLVSTWKEMGKPIAACVTDMGEPLGAMVGNFLEVEEAMDFLEGKWPDDLGQLTRRLGAWMLVSGGKAKTPEEGERLFDQAIASGTAMEKFMENVEAQGGDADKLLTMRGKYRAPQASEFASPFSGTIGVLDAYQVALASVELGVGRAKAADSVFPDSGIRLLKKSGQAVQAGEPLAILYGRSQAALDAAAARMALAYAPAEGGEPTKKRNIVRKEIIAL